MRFLFTFCVLFHVIYVAVALLTVVPCSDPLTVCPYTYRLIFSVNVSFSSAGKHELPVGSQCPWGHNSGLAGQQENICTSKTGKATTHQNQTTLWNCVLESACKIQDERLQFGVFRDPRAVSISYYFWNVSRMRGPAQKRSVDEFVIEMLPTICQWVSLRYLVFGEIIKAQSSLFWYDDAFGDTEQWHRQFLEFVGLDMPFHVVKQSSNAAQDGGGESGVKMTEINIHVGGQEASPSRSYKDEITAETLAGMDDVLRIWLPPVLLERLGVAL